ncbi:hypothetical protein PV327_005284 [Microctonus hyperodae]|uniref:Transcription termination factor, mitochondrial n=1 Tax=Microctonus hyperodae TaxID=165561 RepID=A0AA39G1G7_MICHY|nr:hypothetical protein PV327_005284 [Microctonus hyperodae]
MTSNLTWCLIRNIFKKNTLSKRYIQLFGYNNSKHTDEGYVNSPQNLHHIDYQEVKSYKQFLNETKTGAETAVSTLMKTLHVSNENATEIVKKWPTFSILSPLTLVDIYKLCEILCRNKFMLSIPIVKLQKVTEYIIDEGGLLREHIIKDLIIYRYSLSRIEERIKLAKSVGISQIKPWIVRCPLEIIEKTGAEIRARNNILGSEKSLAKFISEELNCSIESADALLKQDPSIEKHNITTLKKLLQFYHQHGYKIEHIYRAPRALHCNIESIETKFDMWMKYSSEKPMLFALVSSNNVFYSKLELCKNKNCKE